MFQLWSSPPLSRRARGAGGGEARGAAGASLIHELLAEAQSPGKIDDRLQVLVGGFIKLWAVGRKSDEYPRFRLGAIPQPDNNKMDVRREGGAVASEALCPGMSRLSALSSELLLLPGSWPET